MREVVVEQPDERADARRSRCCPWLLPSSSALRPSKSRRLTSLPSVAPTISRAAVDRQHDLGLGIVPGRVACRPIVARRCRRADNGWRLGEHLGVGADAHLEVLRPSHATAISRFFSSPPARARPSLRQVGADRGVAPSAPHAGRHATGRPWPAPRSRARAGWSTKVTPAALIACRSHRRQQMRHGGVALRAAGVARRMSGQDPPRRWP